MMKNILSIFIAVSLILLMGSCHSQKRDRKQNVVHFADVQSDEWLSRIQCKFIPLETNDSCLIAYVNEAVFTSSRIFIIDTQNRVYAFDISGKFIAQVCEVGDAPGDCSIPKSLHVDEEKQELIVADIGKAKLLYFDLNTLAYKQGRQMDYFGECAWFPDGDIVWVSGGSFETPKREKYRVKFTDSEGNLKKYDMPVSYEPQYTFSSGTYFYTLNGNVYLNLPFTSTIYKMDEDGCEEAYTISVEGHTFAPMDWLKANAEENYYRAITKSDYINTFNVKETDHFISLVFLERGKPYVGFYNKETEESILYEGVDFMEKTSLEGIGKVITTHGNYFLSVIESDALLEQGTSNEELREIASKLEPESNPILCLFKFE